MRGLSLPENSEAAGFGSDTSPRDEMKRWAEPEESRSTSFKERIGFSEPPERRGWDTISQTPFFSYVNATAVLVLAFAISGREVPFSHFFQTKTFLLLQLKVFSWVKPLPQL